MNTPMHSKKTQVSSLIMGITGFFAGLFTLIPEQIVATEFPYTYRSSYYLGRGDTGIAEAENEDGIFYNPGAIGFGKSLYKKTVVPSLGLQFSTSIKDIVTKIGLQDEESTDVLRDALGVPQHAGLNLFTGVILKRVAVGAYATSTNTILIAKDPDEGAIEKASIESSSTYGMAFTVSEALNDMHGVGLTTRIVTKSQASASFLATDASAVSSNDELIMTGSGYAFDLGYLFKYKGPVDMNFGLTIQNIGDTTYTPNTETSLSESERPLKKDPQMVNFGYMLEKTARLSKFKFLFDYYDLLNNTGQSTYKKIHMGGELSLNGYLGLTTGLNQGYPTVGTYLDIRLLRIDAGMYSEELGDQPGERGDRRYYFRLLTGF